MQATARYLTLFHCPHTRSTRVLILLEKLQADDELHVLNMKAGEQRGAAYLAINPMRKVPAVQHGAALVMEQAAIYLYLADLYPEARLAPGLTDSLREPYLRWIVHYASCFEPAVIDPAQKRESAPVGMSPCGDFDTMLKTLTDQLTIGPYMLGERFTAIDILWGTALRWITKFGLVPVTPVIACFLERIYQRPSIVKMRAKDAELAAALA